MYVFLETDRLVLRRFTEDDVDNLVALDGDPDVIRFINGGKPTPRDEIENDFLPRFLHYYERFTGYGFWAAIEKASENRNVPGQSDPRNSRTEGTLSRGQGSEQQKRKLGSQESPGHAIACARSQTGSERISGEFVGWFHFRPPEGGPLDEAELGYRLRKSAWGKGYGTEGSRALIHKGFTELGVRRVFAETMAVNLGSRRVMEKAGLKFVRTFHQEWAEVIDGSEHGEVEYALDKADYRPSVRAR